MGSLPPPVIGSLSDKYGRRTALSMVNCWQYRFGNLPAVRDRFSPLWLGAPTSPSDFGSYIVGACAWVKVDSGGWIVELKRSAP